MAEGVLRRLTLVAASAAFLLPIPTAEATVFVNTTVAGFGSFGSGVCQGGAVGISGYEAGQVVIAHPTATIESPWNGRLQVTALPGPVADQVGYKVCNVGTTSASSPPAQPILLAAVSLDSGQSAAIRVRDFGSIAAHACLVAVESVPGAQPAAAVTAQPNAPIAAAFGATGGLQVSALPGPGPDQITLKACNVTAASINPPSQSFLLASFPSTTPGAATNTSTLSYGQIAAGGCHMQSFGVPGATPGDAVIVNPIVPVGAGYAGTGKLVVTALSAFSGAPNEGSYKVCNVGTTPVSPAIQSFRFLAIHPPPPPCDSLVDPMCGDACDPMLDPACDPCAAGPTAGCSDSPAPRCGGRRATIVGTSRPDRLRGTKKRDVIVGRGGGDTIVGRGGGDLICGGGGNDKLFGSAGADQLYGGAGADKLFGGEGGDRCDGGGGKDRAAGCERTLRVP